MISDFRIDDFVLIILNSTEIREVGQDVTVYNDVLFIKK